MAQRSVAGSRPQRCNPKAVGYENRLPPEGTNVSSTSPLLEFVLLLGAVLVGILVLVFALSVIAGTLARFVPFSVEERLAGMVLTETEPQSTREQQSASSGPRQVDQGTATDAGATLDVRRETYLRALAERLAARMSLPAGMQIHLHYVDQPVINAYATFGGHVFIYQGLLDELESENALALVIAHEIGHVRARHPIVAAGRGLTLSLALGSLLGLADTGAVQGLVNWLGVTSSLTFSRAQELEADALAAAAVTELYGHLDGAAGVFDLFARENTAQGLNPPELLSTHPDPADRARRLRDRAAALGISGSLTPLPAALFSAGTETE